jgi:hypothetical protein
MKYVFNNIYIYILWIPYYSMGIESNINNSKRRRVRIWYCPCCHSSTRRYKGEEETKFFCSTCKKNYKSGRHEVDFRVCRCEKKSRKIQNKISKFSERYYSKLRKANGQVLTFSKTTKQLWKKVMKAKTKPCLVKRAQEWIVEVEKDMKRYPENDIHWAKEIYKDGEIRKKRGGWSAPVIKLVDTYNSLHGQFKAGVLIGGVFIELNKNKSIEKMKETLLHETLHYIDSCSETPSNHDCYFQKRLEILKGKFYFRGGENEKN